MGTPQAATVPFPTVNVVPQGFKWSPELANRANEKGQFIRVGGTKQTTKRFLSGAPRRWASADPEENQTIFHTGYRITGTPQNVRLALQYAGIDNATIDQVLASSITRDNYTTTKAAEFQQEVENAHRLKGNKPAVEGYSWDQIIWFWKQLPGAIVGTKSGEQRGAIGGQGRGGTTQSLGEKIRNLKKDQVIDVSNIDPRTGKGARTVNRPKTNKSGKLGTKTPGVPIISNNLDNYIRAIELIYGPDGLQAYAGDIQAVRDELNRKFNPGLVGARPPSPRGGVAAPATVFTPGAVLAPQPTFRPASPRAVAPVTTVGGGGLAQIPPITNLLRQ